MVGIACINFSLQPQMLSKNGVQNKQTILCMQPAMYTTSTHSRPMIKQSVTILAGAQKVYTWPGPCMQCTVHAYEDCHNARACTQLDQHYPAKLSKSAMVVNVHQTKQSMMLLKPCQYEGTLASIPDAQAVELLRLRVPGDQCPLAAAAICHNVQPASHSLVPDL